MISVCLMSPDKRAKHTSWAKHVAPHLREKKTIVYVDFVDDVHPLAIAIREEGFTTLAYHGKRLTAHDKKKALETWSIWHGAGIDTPDVDLVVQIGCSPSIEQMVQQMGRAGRDGRPCTGKDIAISDKYSRHQSRHLYLLTKLKSSVSGMVLYHEDDLQHASFWCESTPKNEVIPPFSASWQYVVYTL